MNLGEQLIAMIQARRFVGIAPERYVREFAERLLPQTTNRPLTVLVAEPDPARFLAAVAVALSRQLRLFLADPNWRANEWSAIQQQVNPDVVLGRSPLRASGEGDPEGNPEPAIAIPTGGTGGRIRFAVHTGETLRAGAVGFQRFAGGEVLNCCAGLPFHHVSGLMPVIRAAVSGGSFVSVPEPEAIGTALEFERPVLSLVPTQLARLLDNPIHTGRLRKFSLILVGGAPLTPEMRKRARQAELPLAPSYGMTETAAAIAVVRPEDFLAGDNSSGVALPGVRLRIDATQPNHEGRIFVQTPTLFCGYNGDYAAPRSPWPTEDTGFLDPANRLFVTGRIRPSINTGGEKVDPNEIERALIRSQIAAEACVLGIPDPEWGEAIVAVYVPSVKGNQSIQQLRAVLKEIVSPHKIPKRWISVEKIPRTASGKLDRHLIDELL